MAADRVVLSCRLFQAAPDGVFQKAEGQDPVFWMKLGEVEATLSVAGIIREFQIAEDSPDGKMLALVVRALDFITVLKLGDTLPSEILTGEPSWDVSPAHQERARLRLSLQLSSWLNGEERAFRDSKELQEVANDLESKKRWNAAFDEAAWHLGFEENGREQVVALIAELSAELAYIEALRDRLSSLELVGRKIGHVRTLYERETTVREIVDAVVRLYAIARKQFTVRFDEVDAQTGEILPVLRNSERQIQYIRKVRDELHCRLSPWSELSGRWRAMPTERCEAQVNLLRDTYRFLALRYAPKVDWPSLAKLGPQSNDRRLKTEMVW